MKRPAAKPARPGRYNKIPFEKRRQYQIARARKKMATNDNYTPKSTYMKRIVALERESKETNMVANRANKTSNRAFREASAAKHDAKQALAEVRKTHEALGSWFDPGFQHLEGVNSG